MNVEPTPRGVVVRGLLVALSFLIIVAVVEGVRAQWKVVVAEAVLAAVGAIAGFVVLRRMR